MSRSHCGVGILFGIFLVAVVELIKHNQLFKRIRRKAQFLSTEISVSKSRKVRICQCLILNRLPQVVIHGLVSICQSICIRLQQINAQYQIFRKEILLQYTDKTKISNNDLFSPSCI